jgi:hypothetical protein
MERRTLRRAVAACVVVLAAAGVAIWSLRARGGGVATAPLVARPPEIRAPEGVRVRVEVVNATTVRGLARRATFHLRDRGFDVVSFTTTSEKRDSTLVLDRSGHPEWARRVAAALGGAAVEPRPDSSRYLDVTVLLGANWRPPAQPLHP